MTCIWRLMVQYVTQLVASRDGLQHTFYCFIVYLFFSISAEVGKVKSRRAVRQSKIFWLDTGVILYIQERAGFPTNPTSLQLARAPVTVTCSQIVRGINPDVVVSTCNLESSPAHYRLGKNLCWLLHAILDSGPLLPIFDIFKRIICCLLKVNCAVL